MKRTGNIIELVVIVGFSDHTQTEPIKEPSHRAKSNVVEKTLKKTLNTTGADIYRSITSELGSTASSGTIRKSLYEKRREIRGVGNTIQYVMREFGLLGDTAPSDGYVLSVTVKQDIDEYRKPDQSMSIVMSNWRFI